MENNECTTLSLRYPTLEERMENMDFIRRIIEMNRKHERGIIENYRLLAELAFRLFNLNNDISKEILDKFKDEHGTMKPLEFNINLQKIKSPEIFPELLGKENKDEDTSTC